MVSSGTVDASNGDEETDARDSMRFERQPVRFRDPICLEASTTLPGGRIVGNDRIISVSNYILSQKRTPDSVIVRIAGWPTHYRLAALRFAP